MKAVQIIAPGRLELTEIASRPLRPWEVRIAVASTCVCGSDLKNIDAPVLLPQVPGHEFSGVIVELSAEAHGALQIDDRVTAFPMMVCFECGDCRSGRLRDCAHKRSLGFQLPGSFAEEVIADSRLVVPLMDGITDEQGALIEHLCCGYRLAKELVGHRLPPDSHVVLIGDGPIALADLQAMKLSGYRNITLIGKHPMRMELARKLGATRVLDCAEIDAVLNKKDFAPADACVMAAPAEQTLDQVLPLLRPGGLVFPQTRIKSPARLQYLKDAGIELGRAFAYELADFTKVMNLIKSGELETESLITNRVDLLDFSGAFPISGRKGSHSKTLIINNRLDETISNYRKVA